jgi:site-specific recombinase XerD
MGKVKQLGSSGKGVAGVDVSGGSGEFWDLVEMFDAALRVRRRSPRTWESYREALTLFIKFLEDRGMPTGPTQIHREHVEEFTGDLAERINPRTGQPMTGKTVAKRYRSLHAWFEWMVSIEETPRSPMEKMRRPSVKKEPPPVLTEEQIGRFMAYLAGQKDFFGRRDYAICLLLLECGLRREEMAALRLDDVDWERHGIVVRRGKGEKARGVGFGDVSALALRAYLRARRSYEPKVNSGSESPMLWLGARGPLAGPAILKIVKR